MLTYLGRRAVSASVTLAMASIVVFALIRVLPGDPVTLLLGEHAAADPLAVAELRSRLGLDRPIAQQLGAWFSSLVRGDLGTSLRTGESVSSNLALRIPRSLELIAGGLGFALLFGIPLGIAAARRPNGPVGRFASVIAIAGFSAPVFVAGILMIIVFSLWLDVLPSSGFVSFRQDPTAHLAALVLPAATVGVNFMGVVARMTRASLVDAISKDYVVLARSKGLSESAAVYRHALPNALGPVVMIVGIRAGNLLGGTVIVEALFDWPGLSSLLVGAVLARDYPVIQGTLLSIFLLFVLISLAIDVCQGIIDPRTRGGS